MDCPIILKHNKTTDNYYSIVSVDQINQIVDGIETPL